MIADKFGGLASYFAIINRLGLFTEAIAWAGQEPNRVQHIEVTIGTEIALENVTILTADSAKVLLRNVSFSMNRGDSLLVCTRIPEAQGKTSLLKAIAGILVNGSGKMQRPPAHEVMFLTPNPDLPTGNLRQALSYPTVDECADDTRLLQTLRTVGLAQLAVRLGGLDGPPQNWKEILSKTEQQRLVLARIVQNKPKYAMIDETSLDENFLQVLYSIWPLSVPPW